MGNKTCLGIEYCVSAWKKLKIVHKTMITFVNVVGPLLIGTLIYILFVPSAWISQYIYLLVGKELNLEILIKPRSFITCYMADCLWAYALFFLIGAIQIEKLNDLIAVLSECVLLEIFIEIMQLLGVFNGTFDVADIIFEMISTALACVIWLLIIMMFGRKNDS